MTYLRTRVIASFGTVCAGALVLAACSGKTLSLGTNSTQAQEVAPSQVSGTVSPCAAGAAHPNVCCTAGPSQASSCVTYPSAPFTACDSSSITYPDPRSCCPLDGSGACAAPPPSDGFGGGDAGIVVGGGCSYACPPGMYAPAGSTGDTCCITDSSGATACSGGGPACSGTCECPACAPDSGECPPCDCPPSPCPTPSPASCGACPAGWQSPAGQPDLCCTTDANGVIECFSQALPPGQSSATLDAGSSTGPGVPIGCSGTGGPDGGVGPCGCQEQANGHTYSVNCDPVAGLCTCTSDNGGPSGSFPDNGTECTNAPALFAACGFPSN